MNLLQKTADALRAHGFDAYTVKTKEEACALALSFIEKTESVTWGGSATIAEIGLIDALKKGGYLAYDR
jgi:L-lactate utilization protein LutB